MISKAKSSHIGGVFSCADILALLYGELLRCDSSGFMTPSYFQKVIAVQVCMLRFI